MERSESRRIRISGFKVVVEGQTPGRLAADVGWGNGDDKARLEYMSELEPHNDIRDPFVLSTVPSNGPRVSSHYSVALGGDWV